MEEIAKLISQYGFPIVVAMYSLTRLEKVMQENTKVLVAISEKLNLGGDSK